MNDMYEDILQLRAAGNGYGKIAHELDIAASKVRYVCKKYGVAGFSTVPVKKSNNDIAEFIAERIPGFEYVGNYTGCDGTADIRCETCGTVMTRSMITIRHSNVKCQTCEASRLEEVEKRKEQKRIETAARREEQKRQQFWERRFQQTEMKICPVCGGVFVGRGKYCTHRCAMVVQNQKGKDRRLRKIQDAMIDKDITLDGLIFRDGNICHICGEECDRNDCWRNENGAFIAGDNYPSIDHIVSLAKGGLHSWENVKLAHRRCNYLKSDQA